MSNKIDDNEDLIEKLKDIFSSIIPTTASIDYPKDALPLGTYVRSHRYKRLGFIVDAYYGDVDKVGKKILIYTVLLMPPIGVGSISSKDSGRYYLSNEYEYEITAYLMMKPIDIKSFTKELGGDFLQ